MDYPVIVKEGFFCGEDKYRFHCWVEVDGEKVLCYLPSNCKLEKMYSLKGRTVLLSQNTELKSKFKYKVESVQFRNTQILLNLSFLNRVIEHELSRRMFSFLGVRNNILREKTICGYKSDLYIEDTNTLIEIKSVLAFSKSEDYPINYSSHMLEQLDKLYALALQQINVYYFIIGLGPTVKQIRVDLSSDYGVRMDRCKKAGVHFIAMNIHNKKGQYCVNEFIDIEYYKK